MGITKYIFPSTNDNR
uniref:Uncharacterized protein n=1 Tax=Arundo donax TaxID=35708 RepID=A0A0A8ZDA9_ARUDO